MPRKAMLTDSTLRFEYHLARELGMTHTHLVHSMSGDEFAHWVAFYNIEARERAKAERDARNKAKARRASH